MLIKTVFYVPNGGDNTSRAAIVPRMTIGSRGNPPPPVIRALSPIGGERDIKTLIYILNVRLYVLQLENKSAFIVPE